VSVLHHASDWMAADAAIRIMMGARLPRAAGATAANCRSRHRPRSRRRLRGAHLCSREPLPSTCSPIPVRKGKVFANVRQRSPDFRIAAGAVLFVVCTPKFDHLGCVGCPNEQASSTGPSSSQSS
jgi:hypothetical protein